MGNDEKFLLCQFLLSDVLQLCLLTKDNTMGFYEELDQYNAREEYNTWLDEQEDYMVRCHEQEISPEVVE